MTADIFKQRLSAACEDRAKACGHPLAAPDVVDLAGRIYTEARKRRRRGYLPPPPRPVGPPGWFAWFAAEFGRVGEDDPAHGQLFAAYTCRAFHMLPASWQQRAHYECKAAAAQ